MTVGMWVLLVVTLVTLVKLVTRLPDQPGGSDPRDQLVFSVSELGKADDGEVFDPNTLDPNRCESCYGAETEDLK